MAEAYCGSEPCPLLLNSTCVFYTGESLLYIGVQTNDTLEAIIVKINQAFQNTGIGYAFTNGVIQPTPSQPVQLGGALIQNTTIGGNFTLTFSGNVQAAKHITTGGTSSQFVKGDGTLDSTAYQPAANYITGLSGDVLASGPGVAAATLATVNFSSGTFGNGNTIPIVTVNSKGLVTNITPTPINLPPISLTFIGDVVGSGLTGSNITLLLQNVNPNPYNTITPLKFSVNGKGLVTSASPITASDIVNILGYSPSGTAGSSGTSGTTGTSGTSGVNGTSGIDGTFGTSGTSGTSGSSATSGTSGTSGSSGTAGTSGSTGTSGSSGTTGTSGSSGTTGTSGSSGTSGTTGTSGSSGTSGTTGTSGSSGLSGDRFKTTSTTTYTLQAPGNPGTLTVDPGLSYTVAQSIIIAYDANNHNEAEVTSYNSITGVINFVTFTLTGSGTYSNWFVNIDGASGGDGSSGSSGTTGTSGSSGTSGTTGTSGSSGTSGTTGTSGSSGTSGTSATDGTGGTSGTSGSSATSGTTGTSGTSATSGTSGTSGTSVAVSGTTNTLAKFTSSTTIGNSLFTDDGTNGAFGGANYSVGTSVRTFNISAPLYAGIGFWANNVYTGDIFSYTVSGNLIIAADPTNILTDSRVILATDGTQRLAVFSDGNVSIANSPTNSGFKLYVASPSTAIAAFEGATNGYVDINDGTVNSRLQNTAQGFLIGTVNSYNLNLRTNNTIRLTIDGSTGAATFSNSVTAAGQTSVLYSGYDSNAEGLRLGFDTSYYNAISATFSSSAANNKMNFVVSSGNGTRGIVMTLQGNGNVGIGSTNPEGKLTIEGTSAQPPTSGTTANSLLQLKGSLGNELNLGSNTVAGNYCAYIQASDNNLAVPYQLNLQPTGGNVIIGSYTDNGARLQVVGTSFAFSVTGSNGAIAGTGLSYINNSDDAFALVLNNAGTSGQNDRGVFDVRRQGNSIFRINNSGNVGIDTNTPNGKLTIRAAASDIPSLVFKNEIGGPSSAISNYVSAAQTFTLFGTNVYVNSTANLSRFDTSKESSAILFDEGLFRVLTGTTGSNPSTRMSITSSGTASFTDSVTAQGFNTSVGTVSAPTSTWVTVYTIPSTQAAEGVYYAYGHYNDDSGGMAFIQVLADRTHLRAINGSNSSVQMQISGRNIQVLQVYGVTLSIQYSILWQKLR